MAQYFRKRSPERLNPAFSSASLNCSVGLLGLLAQIINMFELAALGLLQQEPLHGYRLKQQLELFMSSCISVNYGTIYPLLKRLEQQGAIAASSDPVEQGNSSSRKVYHITPLGHQRWQQKMMEHPHESWINARSRFMIKCCFFKYLQPTDRLKLINHRLMVCQLRLEGLEQQDIEQNYPDVYQASVWTLHLNCLRSEIEWLHKLLTGELGYLHHETLLSELSEDASPQNLYS